MKNNSELSSFLKHIEIEQGVSPNTVLTYRSQLSQYLKYLDSHDLDLKTSSHPHIVNFLESKKQQGHKSATLFHTVIVLKRFHQFLTQNGYCGDDISSKLSLPRVKSRLPYPLSVEEIKKILDRSFLTSFTQIRNQALLELLYATAMRASELINLTMAQVDMKNCWVRVMGKGERERIVPFGETAQKALLAYLEARHHKFGEKSDCLFLSSRGKKLTRGGFWWILKQRAEEVGIKSPVFPHRIRHTTITHLLSKGADIRSLQSMAGHRDIQTTQRYAHVTPDFLKRTFNNFHPRV